MNWNEEEGHLITPRICIPLFANVSVGVGILLLFALIEDTPSEVRQSSTLTVVITASVLLLLGTGGFALGWLVRSVFNMANRREWFARTAGMSDLPRAEQDRVFASGVLRLESAQTKFQIALIAAFTPGTLLGAAMVSGTYWPFGVTLLFVVTFVCTALSGPGKLDAVKGLITLFTGAACRCYSAIKPTK